MGQEGPAGGRLIDDPRTEPCVPGRRLALLILDDTHLFTPRTQRLLSGALERITIPQKDDLL
jgi:hypothetical protein